MQFCCIRLLNPVSLDSGVSEPPPRDRQVLHTDEVNDQSNNLRFQFRLHPKGWFPPKYKFFVQSKEDFASESNKCRNPSVITVYKINFAWLNSLFEDASRLIVQVHPLAHI